MNLLFKYRLFALMIIVTAPTTAFNRIAKQGTDAPGKIETIYDDGKNETTVRMTPVKIASEEGKYHSVHMSPSFTYPGRIFVRPKIINFELQTIIRGRLRSDLYVVFIVDGETIFLSSNRWAIKRPVPDRTWVGERLVFRAPYEVFMKLARGRHVEVKMDAVRFQLGESQLATLRDFAKHML